jgi:hypothetical protein
MSAKLTVVAAIVAVVMLITGGSADAGLLAYDGSEYTDVSAGDVLNGDTSESTPGSWGAWGNTAGVTYVDSSLTYAGLTDQPGWEPTGGASQVLTSGSSRSFNGTDAQGVSWFSVLLQFNGGVPPFARFLLYGDSQSSNDGFGFQVAGDGIMARITGSNGDKSAATVTLGQTHLFVGKIDFDADSTAVSVWMDPAGLSNESALGTATAAHTADPVEPDKYVFGTGSWFYPRYEDNGGNTGVVFDEFRAGTELGDVVVPEPATMALLGLGGLVAHKRRRR